MIRWSTDDSPKDDLSGLDSSRRYWDVIDALTDGWVVYAPGPGSTRIRYVYAQTGWVASDSARGVLGAVTREQARVFAEKLESPLTSPIPVR